MPAYLMWALMVGLGGVGSGMYLNKAAIEDEKNPMEPELGGMDARNVVLGVGALAALVFGGPIGALGIGAAVAAWTSKDAMTRVSAALEEFKAHQQLDKPKTPVKGLLSESDPIPGWVADLVREAA